MAVPTCEEYKRGSIAQTLEDDATDVARGRIRDHASADRVLLMEPTVSTPSRKDDDAS